MELVFSRGFGAAQGVADLQLVETRGGRFLLAIERLGGGIRSYDLADDLAGDLAERDYRPHQGAGLGTGQGVLLGAGAEARLLLAGSAGPGLDSHQLRADGHIAAQDHWALPGTAQGLGSVTSTELAGGNAVFAIADGQLMGWRLSDRGEASAVALRGDSDAYTRAGTTALTVVEVGGQQILLAADAAVGGVLSYRINGVNGALTPADQLGRDQGLGIAAPAVLEGFVAHGRAWVILGAAGTGSLSVMAVAGDGSLSLVDHVIDSAASRFGGVTAVEPFVVGDHVFVLAAGGDGGLELLRFLPSGQLVHAARIEHRTGQGAQNVTALEVAVTGEEIQIFVASEGGLNDDGEGIARYRLDRADLGDVSTANGGRLRGAAGDDLLMGGDRPSHLRGGAGDDMLVQGAAGDELEGGDGRDIFVVRRAEGRVVIADFRPGQDQLDLTLVPGLRSLSQLRVDTRHDGLELRWQDLVIRIQSHDGRRLEITDIWPLGWERADRLPLGETLPASTLRGGAGSDSLLGDDADDSVAGGGGNDTIDGQGGDDRLEGGSGNDRILGGRGNDSLDGGTGNDSLSGGVGNDHLEGGSGADTLSGGHGSDQLSGGDGSDQLRGGDGGDVLRGDAGDDSLFGDAGNDQLLGGSGQDTVSGGTGDDSLDGGSGADVLQGGSGDDQLLGGDGHDRITGDSGRDDMRGGRDNDTIFGGADNDRLWGDSGHDRLLGQSGSDSLFGGAGNDRLLGGSGRDLLRGGSGTDVLLGQSGNDRLYGNSGDDRLYGGGGADSLRGGRGNDRLKGGTSSDDLRGDSGRDTLIGGTKGDTLRGGSSADVLWGNLGQDRLFGQNGHDRLIGGAGHDQLWGGSGADVFVFNSGHGRDRVMDFEQGRDRLSLVFAAADRPEYFDRLSIRAVGDDLRIDTGQGRITLVDAADLVLGEDDFLF